MVSTQVLRTPCDQMHQRHSWLVECVDSKDSNQRGTKMSEGLKKEVFPMDTTPAEITIYGNWFLTQGDIYWRDRYFYFRLKHSYASFHEYTGEGWPERQEEQIQEWGMDYPQDEVTSKEVAKLFWHLVVTTDPQYLEAHEKSLQEFCANLAIKGEQK